MAELFCEDFFDIVCGKEQGMKKEEFLRELEYLLSDLPDEEREEAVGYYRDYLDEAGQPDEEELIGRLGSPEKTAAEIRAGLSGNSQGEFTERGYQDERFREAYHVPDQYAEIVAADGKARKDSESGSAKGTEREQESENSGWASFEREGKSCREEWSKWRKEREQRFERAQGQCGGRQERAGARQERRSERARERYERNQERRDRGNTGEPRWWEYKGSKGQQSGRADDVWEGEVVGRERSGGRGDNGNRGLILFLLLLFFGLPAAGTVIGAGFSIVGGILGGIFGIFGGVFGLVAAAFAAAVGIFGGGIALILSGAADWTTPAVSLMSIGGGFLLLALAMLLLILTKWGCGTAVPWMIRLIRDIIRTGIGWLRELSDRIFRDRRERL